MAAAHAAVWRARWRRLGDPDALGAKLVLILTAVGLAGAIGITLLLAGIITPSFNRLEAKALAVHRAQADVVLAEFAGATEQAARDEADRASGVTEGAHRPGGRGAGPSPGIDGIVRVDANRNVVAEWPASQRLHGAFVRHLAHIDPARIVGRDGSRHYYARLGDGVAAIGIAPVRIFGGGGGGGGAGRRRGWVVAAAMLSSSRATALLRLDAHVTPAFAPALAPSAGSRTISVPIPGVDGRAIADVRFAVARDVSLLGRRVLLLAVAGSTLLLLLILVMLRRIIGRLVLRPLARVEAHMQRISASGSLALLGDDRRRDEIGSLGRSFNAMLRQLHALREQIEVQSFQLGRSESAVAVMHNVRNALNPISTILSQGRNRAPAVDGAALARALGELAAGEASAVRRQKLVAFVTAAVAAEAAAREAMQHDLVIGREAMAHVLEIIGQQQKQAHERPTLEDVDIGEIVARNAAIARYSDLAAIAVAFPSGSHRAMANRVILSQVIGNLIGNAAEAIAATGRGSGTIMVTTAQEGPCVAIRIRDDGDGFLPGEAAMLFQRGFSTRQHKSGGLGLHWCANSMVAMDGSLRLDSDGPGRGAVATLTLRAPPAIAIAA